MKLVPVGKEKKAVDILYALLAERAPDESISHQRMPSLDDHRKFVRSNPYRVWYLIQVNDDYVGCCYITKAREIGISIFQAHRRKGYATQALRQLIALWPGRFYANINPQNEKSQLLFQNLGFNLLQMTYVRKP
jgi:RimJ/RimL family protein N-acetyltransferase